ncbi:MAG: hypothetical protein AAGA48_21990 [Myxococcota bacterium]
MRHWGWALFGLLGCATTSETTTTPEAECATAPVLTWANFGQGFLIENCQACHASTSPNRQGAPTTVFFDREEDAWMWSERILERATGEQPDMPPQDGVDVEDRTRLRLWLTCGG